MKEGFDLQEYLTGGIEKIVAQSLKVTLKDPRQSAFMASFATASARAAKKRARSEAEGEHIPPYLICSVTSSCNLHCEGCYSRHNHATVDGEPVKQLTDEEWGRIFDEAEELGVSFILLAGGEPMLRRGVIEAAGRQKHIMFPVFTNGTYMDDEYFAMLDKCRNIIPMFSIEGGRDVTDTRRGAGIYDRVIANMDRLHEKNLIFGASVTVTTENMTQVYDDEFLKTLSDRGCKLVIYVEYVPMTDETLNLAPTDKDREYMISQMDRLREEKPEMIFVSFPGDEKSSGGCIAAGRGFFHINSHGGAEPCPFSPYSDINVRDTSLRQALSSPLFRALRESDMLTEDHPGGCVLNGKRMEIEGILSR